MPKSETFQQLPAPWDRIFSLTTRLFVWGLLLAILYLLRPFFLLIFLTFVFAYIQSHGVEGLEHRFKKRAYRVTLVFIVFLGLIVATIYFLAPHVRDQTTDFLNNSGRYMKTADTEIYKFIDRSPTLKKFFEKPADDKKETDDGKGKPGDGKPGDGKPGDGKPGDGKPGDGKPGDGKPGDGKPGDGKPGDGKPGDGKTGDGKPGDGGDEQNPDPKQQPPTEPVEREPIVQKLVMGMFRSTDKAAEAKNGASKEAQIDEVITPLIKGAAGILGATSSFLLAILFSFLIVLDLPKLTNMVRSLADTKLDFIYEEVAGNINMFARRLGRVLEAQVIIALVNTVLTAIGVYLLGIPNITFLSAIVFFCSFIPVAGVFISSAPICLLALQSGGDSGIQLMLLAIGMVLLVHTIEAYILNPKIYGHHLRMNAVLVLIVLTIGGKLFGVWGLVLGLPVVNYVFSIAIRREPSPDGEPPTAPAKPEPAS